MPNYKHTILMFFLRFILVDCDFYSVTFDMTQGKAMPTAEDPVEFQQCPSIFDCLILCDDQDFCLSFYAEKNGAIWKCYLFDHRLRSDEFPTGNGAVSNYVRNGKNDAPELNQATFRFRAHNQHRERTAVFWCSGQGHGLGIEYDYGEDSWPDLSTLCFQTLCSNQIFAAATLRLSFDDDNWEKVEAVCPYGDTKQSPVRCNTKNKWEVDESTIVPILPLCVSSFCYRFDSKGRAIYNGTTNVASNGETCKSWNDVQDVNDTYFPVDYGGKLGASNYCRDPFSYGKLGCIGQASSLYVPCDISKCQWPIVIN